MPQNALAATVMRVLSGSSYFQRQPQGNPQAFASNISDLWVGQRVPANYEGTYAGNTFFAASQAAATLSNALATTYTGFCLSNPAASGKNLVLISAQATILVEPAAIQPFGLITGWSAAGVVTHTTPITAWGNSYVGLGGASPPASIAKVDAACTIVGTPVWSDWFGALTTGTLALAIRSYNGSVIIAPGGYAAFGAFGGAGPTTGFLGSMTWAEEAIS